MQLNSIYASEADLLNVALFGKTAKQWREENKNKDGNIRDEATIEQLLVLANLESYNAILTTKIKDPKERLPLLREMVVRQLKSLAGMSSDQLRLSD